MKNGLFVRVAILVFFLIAISLGTAQTANRHASSDTTLAKPEAVGFSSERLENLHKIIQDEIDNKQLTGAITILARHGKIVDYHLYGQSDSKTPMAKDIIFRDYSMTKPVTGVAMLILYEQGKWLPNDPISKYIPEFKNLKVFNGVDKEGKPILVDPDHAPTMRELMSHSAGFSYGNGNTLVDAMYKDLKLRPMKTANLQEMIDSLAKIPLNYQPGKGWTYSLSMDIEGYLVEKLSGQTLPDFMHDHIFVPLGMKDAGFFVPQDKRSRFVTNYRESQGQLGVTDAGSPPTDYTTQPTAPSGGGGMVSTAEDYYHFAQMLGNGGEFDGKRVLAPSTVKLMSTNHLPDNLLTGEFGIGQHIMRPGFGYGINCAVVFDPPAANLPDGKGTFFWDGAAGTWFWVDPTNDVVFVGMIQRMTSPDNHPLLYRTHAAVYGALVDPSK